MHNQPSSQSSANNTGGNFHDQRIHPRTLLSSTVSVFNNENKEYIGLLVDVSDSGLMISSYQPLTEGQTIEVDIVEIPKNKAQRLTGKMIVEVVWSHMVSTSMYGNGCLIKEQDVTSQNMLHSYQD